MNKMTVMILASPEDAHAQSVMEVLTGRGVPVELMDLAEFPTRLTLSMRFENGARTFALRRPNGERLDLSAIRSVWWRRPELFDLPPAFLDPAHRGFAVSEAAEAFQALYQSLDAFWVNDPGRDAEAGHKPWQLALAQRVGLSIPSTLVTNDPAEAREFWRRQEGKVISKTFRALPEAWRETRLLRPEERTLADSVRYAPVVFQSYIPAAADLRVTVVGDEIFAASARARAGDYAADVRFNFDVPWEAHVLPAYVQESLHALMCLLHLEYGAIDLRLTPSGEYVFLEINPAGQFRRIELATGQKISEALASHLAAGRSRHLAQKATSPIGTTRANA